MPEVHTLTICKSIVERGLISDLIGIGSEIRGDFLAFAEVGDCPAGTSFQIMLVGPDGEELDVSPEILVPVSIRDAQAHYDFPDSNYSAGPYRIRLLIDGEIARERDFTMEEKA